MKQRLVQHCLSAPGDYYSIRLAESQDCAGDLRFYDPLSCQSVGISYASIACINPIPYDHMWCIIYPHHDCREGARFVRVDEDSESECQVRKTYSWNVVFGSGLW